MFVGFSEPSFGVLRVDTICSLDACCPPGKSCYLRYLRHWKMVPWSLDLEKHIVFANMNLKPKKYQTYWTDDWSNVSSMFLFCRQQLSWIYLGGLITVQVHPACISLFIWVHLSQLLLKRNQLWSEGSLHFSDLNLKSSAVSWHILLFPQV